MPGARGEAATQAAGGRALADSSSLMLIGWQANSFAVSGSREEVSLREVWWSRVGTACRRHMTNVSTNGNDGRIGRTIGRKTESEQVT
jgi:hypothetical protein